MNSIIIPVMADGTSRISEFRFNRTYVGPDGYDTWSWEWGVVSHLGWQVIDQGEVQHREALGLFALFHRVLGCVLGVKSASE
jgi:hypothetical protein